ncbi:MAG: glycoside hydrolase, partial [Opitutaceae bacterium]
HYSPRNSRLDWLSLNHYADISDGAQGVTLSSADCSFMRVGRSTMTSLDPATPLLSVLAGGNVSGTKLHITHQGGGTHFTQRFALTTHDAFDPVEAMRFALEHQNPLVTGSVTGGTVYPEKSYSLLKTSSPAMFVWAVKPAEEGIGQGVIARLWNVGHRPVEGLIEFAHPLGQARQTTHIETDLEPVRLADGKVPVSLAAQQMKTFRLNLTTQRKGSIR